MKYIVGAIVVIVAAIAAILMLSSRPEPTTTSESKTKSAIKLTDYANKYGSEVSLTTQGKVVGDEDFRSIRVKVTQYNRTVEVLKGYDNTVDKTQQFTNTRAAYDTFLHSLANLGFTKSRKANYADERGVCPTGNRFIYLLQEDGNDVHRSWSASCGNVGSFAGASQVRQLFQSQIPEYSKFVQGVQL